MFSETEQRIGKKFAELLRSDLSDYQWSELRYTNAIDQKHCASHNYCDANTVMMLAFEEVVGREPRMECDVLEGLATQEQSDADINLWNSSWNWALVNLMRASEQEAAEFKAGSRQ